MTTKHKLEYGFLRSIIFFINLLPVTTILWISGVLGRLAWIIYPFRLDVAHSNLSTVFPQKGEPEKMRLLKKTYINFAKTFGLIFILHRKQLMELVANAEIGGREKLNDALAKGKGVILTTYHGCWFEAYFAWFNRSNLPTTLIYQQQSNPLSDAFFIRQRNRYGTSLEHLASKAGMKEFENALKRNRLLIVSLDQRYSAKGINIPLFGREFPCAKGTGVLHLRTGAPVLTSVYYMKEGKLHIDFDTVELPQYDTIDNSTIQDVTAKAITNYESYIQEYPEQWFSLFHKLWSKKGFQKVPRNVSDIFFS